MHTFVITPLKFFSLLLFWLLIVSCGETPSQRMITTQTTTTENIRVRTTTRIACIGDSITFGFGITDEEKYSYPSQLQEMLGSSYEVYNYGIVGATVLKAGEISYWNQEQYIASLQSQPDIVIILLGTNDAYAPNWLNHKNFVADYSALIESYEALESQPKIYIALPSPVFGADLYISNNTLALEVIPKIEEVAAQKGIEVIDLYRNLYDKGALFPDGMHPSEEGSLQIAQLIYDAI